MEPAEARQVLGVSDDATPDEVRAAYRRLVREHHPDVSGPHNTQRAADITIAYRALRGRDPDERPEPGSGAPSAGGTSSDEPGSPPASGAAAPSAGPFVERVDDNSFALELPGDEAFMRLLEVGHLLGEVTYVDPEGGLIETIVQFDEGSTCSAVFTSQGRGNGTTEVFCTLARLAPAHASTPAPAARIVVDAAMEVLAAPSAPAP